MDAGLYCREWGRAACVPAWVCAPGHPPRREQKPKRGSQTAERLGVSVGLRGLSPRVWEPGAGLGMEGSFLSGPSFPEHKSDHISPLLQDTPGPSAAYREMATFPSLSKPPTNFLSPLPSQGLPSLWGGGGPRPDRKMGGAFWEGQGPAGAFGCSRGSCLRPAPNLAGGWVPEAQTSYQETVSCSSNALVDLPFCFSGSSGIVPSEKSHWC